jgi:uncharacterized protein
MSYKLTTDVFCLDHLDGCIAYAPLKGLVLMVNRAAADLLAQLHEGTGSEPDEHNLEAMSILMDLGLVNGTPDELHEDGDGQFRPTETTLFLTRACSLRCIYCYASGGEHPNLMPWPVAQAAVDLVVENAATLGKESVGVSFHGAGEPTLAWNLLTGVADYARENAAHRKLNCHCGLATNGVLTAEQTDWIIEHIDDVNVSIDGLQGPHDEQRPLKDGKGSFASVWRTVEALSEHGRPFGLRMTITAGNVRQVPEAVRFFCERTKPGTIHIEPVFQCGRCVVESVAGPTCEEFLAVFREAREIADQCGVRLYYSGARYPEVTMVFCQAAGKSFTVTTEGRVTACYEVADEADPRSRLFFYGRYDEASSRFTFDDEMLRTLSELTVRRIPFCQDCFCKYHCAGDCPAKRMAAFSGGMPDRVSSRCRITQELTKDQIIRVLHQGSRTMRVMAREHGISGEAEHGAT